MVRDAGRPGLALFAPVVVAPTLAAPTASTVDDEVLLLTPTGSAPSPGWRRWAFASSAAMAALAVAATVAPGSVDARVLSIEGPVGPTPSVAPWPSSTSSPWPPPSSSSLAGPARW